MPKVSVVIPAYNCERFISTAIESVLEQTYKDYEIIVVDDGSTDNTAKVLSRLNSKIKYIFQTNGGPAKGRNTGILNARGEYVAFLDADDAWLPNKLKMQMEVLEKRSNLGLIYSDIYIIDDRYFVDRNSGLRAFQVRPPHRGKVLKTLFLVNFIPTTSVVMRKECFEKIGLFNPILSPIEDYDRWLRLSVFYEVDYIDRALAKYRDHVSIFRKNRILTITNIINTLNGVAREYHVVRDTFGKEVNQRISQLYAILGKSYLLKGLFKKAFYNFSVSFKLTKSLSLPCSILFSFSGDCIKSIFRYIKSKIRKPK